MDIPWDDVAMFLAVAETGSLSAAAKRLRIGQPTVSRRLAALEYRVGTPLFLRSVGGAALTSAGERLVAPARRMAEWAGEVARVAGASDTGVRGLVRVTASPFFCFEFLSPFAAVVASKHPGLRLEVLSSMQYLDLGRGEADLAIRPRAPTQPELAVLVSLTLKTGVFVSRALAAKLPKRPRLDQVPWLGWAPPFESVPPQPQLEAAIPGFTPSFTSDNFLVNLSAAEAGVGAIVLAKSPHRFMRPRGLVEVPLDLGPWATTPLHLVCAKSALDVPRVRAVAHLLVKELEAMAAAR